MRKATFLFLLVCLSILLMGSYQANDSEKQLLPARDFLISQFSTKDIILLGEFHRIKEYPAFVAKMIPLLHKNGINILFSEFALFEDSKLIDSLINCSTFNEKLAIKIQHHDSWDWAYQEYIDIYRAAWAVNHAVKKGEENFRIIGLERKESIDLDYDMAYAKLVSDSAIKKNRKALVYCGINHAFTAFNHPYVVNGKAAGFVSNRMGNLLYKKYPEKVATVIMHGPWPSMTSFPYAGYPSFVRKLDSISNALPGNIKEFGFLTSGSFPLDLRDDDSYYSQGYPASSLKNYCQGYIVLVPVCQLSPVSIIPDFINSSNIEDTRKRAGIGDIGIHAFNDTIRKWLDDESDSLRILKIKHCGK